MPLRLAIQRLRPYRPLFPARPARIAGRRHNLQVVAINEPANLESMAYLHDSTHGRFPGQVEVDGQLLIDGHAIAVSHARSPEEVDWAGIDLVVECSGAYGKRGELARFLDAGCPRLLLLPPGR